MYVAQNMFPRVVRGTDATEFAAACARSSSVRFGEEFDWSQTADAELLTPSTIFSQLPPMNTARAMEAMAQYQDLRKIAAESLSDLRTAFSTLPNATGVRRWMLTTAAMWHTPALGLSASWTPPPETSRSQPPSSAEECIVWKNFVDARNAGVKPNPSDLEAMKYIWHAVRRDIKAWAPLLERIALSPTTSPVWSSFEKNTRDEADRIAAATSFSARPNEERTGISASTWRQAVVCGARVERPASRNSLNLAWANQDAVRAATRFHDTWGAPSMLGTQEGGGAVWKRVPVITTSSDATLPFDKYEEVAVHDTVRMHDSHVDCVTHTVRTPAPTTKDESGSIATLMQLKGLCGALRDGEDMLLSVNCTHENTAHAALAVASKIFTDSLDVPAAMRLLEDTTLHKSNSARTSMRVGAVEVGGAKYFEAMEAARRAEIFSSFRKMR